MGKKKSREYGDLSEITSNLLAETRSANYAANAGELTELSVPDLSNLPPDQQQLITWLSGRKQATFREIQDVLGQDDAEIRRMLDTLRASNMIYQALNDGEISYRFAFPGTTRQRSRGQLSELWLRFELDQVAFLRQLTLFQDLSDEQLQEIAANLEECQYTRDEVILWQGDVSERIYFIKSGVVGITRFSVQDKEEKLLRYLKPGDILGEYSTLLKQGGAATSTVTALSSVTMLAMTKPTFLEFLQKYPSIAVELASRLVRRLLENEARAMSVAGTRLCVVVGVGAKSGVTTLGNTLALTLAHVNQKSTVYTEQPGTAHLSALFNIPPRTDIYNHAAGYDVMAAPELAELPATLSLALIYDRLVSQYSNIVIGVPFQAEDIVNYLVERADQIILVTTPDSESWLALNRLSTRLHAMVHPEKVSIFSVINRPRGKHKRCAAPGHADFDLPFLEQVPSLSQQTFDNRPAPLAEMTSVLADRLGRTNQVGIYIPTTVDVDQALDTTPFVEGTLAFLGQHFGGATTSKARGVWNSTEAGLVDEDIYIVRSYATQADLDRCLQEILHYVEGLKEDLRQEAMAVEINQKLILI